MNQIKDDANTLAATDKYDEICGKAEKFLLDAGGREKIKEFTAGMTLMERATFVQALSCKLDFETCCIWRLEHKDDPAYKPQYKS